MTGERWTAWCQSIQDGNTLGARAMFCLLALLGLALILVVTPLLLIAAAIGALFSKDIRKAWGQFFRAQGRGQDGGAG